MGVAGFDEENNMCKNHLWLVIILQNCRYSSCVVAKMAEPDNEVLLNSSTPTFEEGKKMHIHLVSANRSTITNLADQSDCL